MRRLILFIFLNFSFTEMIFGQTDSTESLFGNAVLTEMNFDAGYSSTIIKGHPYNGITVNYLAPVFNDKIRFGLGIDFYGKKYNPGVTQTLSLLQPSEYTSLSLNYVSAELLIRPKKLINFSVPLKIAMATAGVFDTIQSYFSTGSYYYYGEVHYYHIDRFFSLSPGINVMLNLLRGMSLGLGGNYRFAFGVDHVGDEADFSNFSFTGFLRFKLNMIEYKKRNMETSSDLINVLAASPISQGVVVQVVDVAGVLYVVSISRNGPILLGQITDREKISEIRTRVSREALSMSVAPVSFKQALEKIFRRPQSSSAEDPRQRRPAARDSMLSEVLERVRRLNPSDKEKS